MSDPIGFGTEERPKAADGIPTTQPNVGYGIGAAPDPKRPPHIRLPGFRWLLYGIGFLWGFGCSAVGSGAPMGVWDLDMGSGALWGFLSHSKGYGVGVPMGVVLPYSWRYGVRVPMGFSVP